MTKTRTTLTTLAVLGGLIIGGAGIAPANAAPAEAAPAASTTTFALDTAQLPNEGLFAQVDAASTTSAKVALLTGNGFQKVEGGGYERTEGGMTLGYRITTTPPKGMSQTNASVGWNGGPYIKATGQEWKNFAQYGVGIGGAFCALITVAWGAVGCGAVAAIISVAVSNGTIKYPNTCYAVRPGIGGNVTIWTEKC
ncbi:hypothetical protein [Clavibacter tessellarius]|uniref:hypothetical protein n=1 Tax=Clavibacter tessellarius TaxID=31965 RepID=UPI0032475CB4